MPTSVNPTNPSFLVHADSYTSCLVNKNGLFQRGYRFIVGHNGLLATADKFLTGLDLFCLLQALPLLALVCFAALTSPISFFYEKYVPGALSA